MTPDQESSFCVQVLVLLGCQVPMRSGNCISQSVSELLVGHWSENCSTGTRINYAPKTRLQYNIQRYGEK